MASEFSLESRKLKDNEKCLLGAMGKLFLVHKLYLVNLVINRTAIEMPSDV